MDTILISEQAACPGVLMSVYATRYLQGENGSGLAVRSQLRIPFRRKSVNVVISGPVRVDESQRFVVSWAAGEDREHCTFTGELYVGPGIAPDSGSIVLSGSYLRASVLGNRARGAGRVCALAVGHALLRSLRVAIENEHALDLPNERASAYAFRYRN